MKTTASRIRGSEGFTLIELLIVVVIIGILAAIAIPQFANTKQRAYDAAAKSDLHNAMTAEEAYFTDAQNYVTFTVAGGPIDLDGDGNPDVTASTNVTLNATAVTAAGTTPASYTITAKHASSPNTYCVNTAPAAADPGKIVKGTSC